MCMCMHMHAYLCLSLNLFSLFVLFFFVVCVCWRGMREQKPHMNSALFPFLSLPLPTTDTALRCCPLLLLSAAERFARLGIPRHSSVFLGSLARVDSALNLAEYAKFRNFKCPVVFGISDNGLSISLRGYNWVQGGLLRKEGAAPHLMRVFSADGNDLLAVFRATREAAEYARANAAPAIVCYTGIVRRFGHAATDRQAAYLSAKEIEAAANHDPVSPALQLAVDAGLFSGAQALELVNEYWALTKQVRVCVRKCVRA